MSLPKPPSQRQLRVGEQVRHGLAQVLQRGQVQDPVLDGVVLSVSEVRMSPDLKIATAYVTPLGEGDRELVVKALNRHCRYIRGALTPELRQMKFMPQIRFRHDDSFDNFQRIDALLNSPVVRQDVERDDQNSED